LNADAGFGIRFFRQENAQIDPHFRFSPNISAAHSWFRFSSLRTSQSHVAHRGQSDVPGDGKVNTDAEKGSRCHSVGPLKVR
jgi:hypothetical protein